MRIDVTAQFFQHQTGSIGRCKNYAYVGDYVLHLKHETSGWITPISPEMEVSQLRTGTFNTQLRTHLQLAKALDALPRYLSVVRSLEFHDHNIILRKLDADPSVFFGQDNGGAEIGANRGTMEFEAARCGKMRGLEEGWHLWIKRDDGEGED